MQIIPPPEKKPIRDKKYLLLVFIFLALYAGLWALKNTANKKTKGEKKMNEVDRKAIQLYGVEFDLLSAGQKAAVKRALKNSSSERTGKNYIKVSIGRAGVNGCPTCVLDKGATLKDLLKQSGFSFDNKKETVRAMSTGELVSVDDTVENGETYIITPEIKSA